MASNSVFQQSRKSGTTVTPSGIQCGILSLIGKHQKDISINDAEKRKSAIDTMLHECISSIGEDTSPSLDKVKKMLSEDKKHLLFQIRQLSNENKEEFKFDYEFPLKNRRKLRDIQTVNFTKEAFPVKPYKWVLDKMREQFREMEGISEETVLTAEQEKAILAMPIPVLYTDYAEILKHVKQQFKLPECGITVKFDLLTGTQENKFGQFLREEDISSHTYIQQRDPKYMDPKLKEDENREVWLTLPVDELTITDIEALRKHMRELEALVETSVVIQYKDDPSITAQVNLITLAAFFFPSLAI